MVAPRWPVHAVNDLSELATWLGVTQERLAWFADRRSLERSVTDERLRHYLRRWLRKADGSARLLEAPKTETKDLQRRILRAILDRIPAHGAAHGFCHGRSIVTAAEPHRGQEVVIRIDLETFFTTVSAGRVYGLFRLAGYPEPVAHTLTGLCTTITPTAVLRDAPTAPPYGVDKRRRMLQALREPHLPQGSPTSPALANLIAYGLDRRLSGLAAKLDATYTRYADDLIFSGPHDLGRRSESVVALVRTIAADEGFRVHEGESAGADGRAAPAGHGAGGERAAQRASSRVRPASSDPPRRRAPRSRGGQPRRSPGVQGAPRRPGGLGRRGQRRSGGQVAAGLRPCRLVICGGTVTPAPRAGGGARRPRRC